MLNIHTDGADKRKKNYYKALWGYDDSSRMYIYISESAPLWV